MDCHLCSVCRRLSKISFLVAVLLASIEVSSMMVSSTRLEEQLCLPRATVIPVQKSGFRPYHIKVHRCSGTCDPSLPPDHKKCMAGSRQEISLELRSITGPEIRNVKVENHTSCVCHCSISCTEQEIPDKSSCKCTNLSGPIEGQTGNRPSNSVKVLPYQIAIAVLGLFALCILIICMVMRHKMSLTDRNGKHISSKENSSPTGVKV